MNTLFYLLSTFLHHKITTGPGQYQTTLPQTENMLETMEPKLTSSFASKSSRLKQPSKHRSKKNNQAAPGPGQYKVRGAFIQKYVPENLQFFGSTQRRFDFKQKKSSMPGPGSLFVLYISSFVYHLL